VRTKTAGQADKILSAAERLFSVHRYHEVRMEDVATEAEVGKGTLYRYFRDKEELYVALLARASDDFMGKIEKVLGGDGSPRARLEAVVHAIIEQFDLRPNLLNLILRSEVMAEGGAAFPWQATRERMPLLLLDLFQEAEGVREFFVRDPDIMVMMLLGGIRAVIRFGEQPRPSGLAHRIVENFLRGVDTRSPTSLRSAGAAQTSRT
jgi:TetR/AcrR family fatty acid metabolism transcriptional regulator